MIQTFKKNSNGMLRLEHKEDGRDMKINQLKYKNPFVQPFYENKIIKIADHNKVVQKELSSSFAFKSIIFA